MAPGVRGREPPALVVPRGGADEALASRRGQRLDCAVESFPGQRLGLAAARAETGTPKQAFGLRRPELPALHG